MATQALQDSEEFELEELAVASHALEGFNQRATGMVREAGRGYGEGAAVQVHQHLPLDIQSCSRLCFTESRVHSSNSFLPTIFMEG